MKDGLIRKAIKRIALLRYQADLAATRYFLKKKGKPIYELRGACKLCARCCESPSIRVSIVFFYFKSLRFLLLKWHSVINGFVYKSENRQLRMIAFRCTHFDPQTRMCDSYDSRPGMCRDYPRNLIYSTNPQFFRQCGYYATHPNAKKFSQSLDKLNLSPQKLEELKKNLHIKE